MIQGIITLGLCFLASTLSENCPNEFAKLQASCICQDHDKVICPNPSVNPNHELLVHYDANDIQFECRKKGSDFLEAYLNKVSFNRVKDSLSFQDCSVPPESYAKWATQMNLTFTKLHIKNVGTESFTSRSFQDSQPNF